ncbi:MAG TPA: NAD(+) diphosphatase [Clostridia bacterium]|nr:NAD(+) diphosphatase [Clostridia bacterium]
MSFMLGSIPTEREDKISFQFLFQQSNLLVKKLEKVYTIPTADDLSYLEYKNVNKLYIGSLDDHSCYTARYPEGMVLPDGLEFLGLRQLHEQIDNSMLQAAFRAVQIVAWDETHRFCGACGEATIKKADEHAKVCPKCGHISYPRLSPAVIVAVTKGDRLLLARNKNFVSGLYSVLAGFVEAGETLEECVKREIREEAGIEVKNIKYFGSQSWPFPNSYMLGFTAEHESGEIQIGEDEIVDARWFSADEIPNIPGKLSISRKLIDWFLEKYQK